jgi:hypothetical protein
MAQTSAKEHQKEATSTSKENIFTSITYKAWFDKFCQGYGLQSKGISMSAP